MSEMRTLKLRIFSRELDKFGSLIEHLVILSLLSFSALEAGAQEPIMSTTQSSVVDSNTRMVRTRRRPSTQSAQLARSLMKTIRRLS
jgi:hypothetical protein